MKVSLIDYTGAGSADPLYAARLLVYTKDTRLTQGAETRAKVAAMSPDEIHEQLGYIAKTIRSSWEFVDYTFEVTGVTRAFTHQLVRTRTGHYAQQAQRVVDMSGFETRVPVTVQGKEQAGLAWAECMENIEDAYRELTDLGIPAQDARGVLPTNVLTNIIAKFDLRTVADLAGKRDNPRAQDEYTEVFAEMAAEALAVHPWIYQFLYPERTRTPALDTILRNLLGSTSPASKPMLNDALKELDALKGVWG